MADAGFRRRVDERDVLREPVLVLGGRHHQQDLDARERPESRRAIPVRHLVHRGVGQVGRARRRAREEPLREPGVGELAGHRSPDGAGDAGDGDEAGLRGHGGLPPRGGCRSRRDTCCRAILRQYPGACRSPPSGEVAGPS
ncbi:hypothetical protein MAFF212519_01040 [Clavibacter michiganensis]